MINVRLHYIRKPPWKPSVWICFSKFSVDWDNALIILIILKFCHWRNTTTHKELLHLIIISYTFYTMTKVVDCSRSSPKRPAFKGYNVCDLHIYMQYFNINWKESENVLNNVDNSYSYKSIYKIKENIHNHARLLPVKTTSQVLDRRDLFRISYIVMTIFKLYHHSLPSSIR